MTFAALGTKGRVSLILPFKYYDVRLADLEGGGVICIRLGDGGGDRAGGGDEAEAEAGEGEVQQHGADAGW